MQKGDPICLVKFPHVTRELQRCQGCAGSAPPDLPALVEKIFPELTTFTPLMREKPSTRGRLKELAKEWMPYRDSREPGEDG